MKFSIAMILFAINFGATAYADNSHNFNGSFQCSGQTVTIKNGKIAGTNTPAFIQAHLPPDQGYNLYYFNSQDNEWEQIGICSKN